MTRRPSDSAARVTPPRQIEIVGGGLAGLSLGLALRRAGTPVLLHEAGDYPRHRVCGEFITGLDADTRDRLGLGPLLADARQHHEVAWFHRADAVHRQTLPEPALALGRHVLDQRLAEAFVAAGGELNTRSRIDPRDAPAGRVFAHGRRAAPGSRWFGLKCHVRELPLSAPLELHLGDRAYVGLCELPEGRVNVSGLFLRRDGFALARDTALPACLRAAGLAALADRLENAGEIDPESRCAVAGLAFGRAPGSFGETLNSASNPPRLALGDAYALIPPFTGNGMAMAFQSAALALDPLLAWSRGDADWPDVVARVSRRLKICFRLRLGTAALVHSALLHPRGQAGLSVAVRAGLLPLNPLYHALH